MKNLINRREMIAKLCLGSATLLGAAQVVSMKAFAEEKRAKKGKGGDADLPWVKPGEGMAKSLNYHASYTEVKDAAMKTARAGVEFGPNQTCSKCMLFTATGTKDGKDAGKCTLFQNAVVRGDGWCSSWAKKA